MAEASSSPVPGPYSTPLFASLIASLISSSSQLQGDESLKDQKVLGLNLALCLFTAPYGLLLLFFFFASPFASGPEAAHFRQV